MSNNPLEGIVPINHTHVMPSIRNWYFCLPAHVQERRGGVYMRLLLETVAYLIEENGRLATEIAGGGVGEENSKGVNHENA